MKAREKAMGRKAMVRNLPAAGRQGAKKFWNFLDNGDTAELQLFGTIQSEDSWWDDDCVTYRDFISDLDALGDKESIHVVIQSCGGDVFAANAIYNALVLNKAAITGTVIGICASAATIVLMACDRREIAGNAILMVHNPSVSLFGAYQAEELLKMSEAASQVKKSIVTAYMGRLDKTEDEISQLMDEESWYVGQEAVDAGFCDGIAETEPQSPQMSSMFMVDGIPYSFRNYMENFVPDSVRKKAQALLGASQGTPGASFITKNSVKKGDGRMGEVNHGVPGAAAAGGHAITDAAQLREAYPALCSQIADEATETERERLRAIDEIAGGIPEDMLAKAKYGEPISAADLALARVKADNAAGSQFLSGIMDDLQGSGAGAVGAEPNAGYDPKEQEAQEHAQKVSGFAAALKKDRRRGKES